MVFSHTTKGQEYNQELLAAFLKKKITLIDYEHITGSLGERLVYFGRYAGICGMIDTLHVFGRKLILQGISNPFSELKSAVQYGSYVSARKALDQVVYKIRRKAESRYNRLPLTNDYENLALFADQKGNHKMILLNVRTLSY